MLRLQLAALLLFALGAANAQPAATLQLRFIGNESVAITDGTLTLVTDFPYESGYSVYMHYDWSSHGLSGDVVSVITHQHRDHWEPRLFAGTNWRVVGPSTLAVHTDRLTVPQRPVRMGAATITGIRTPHAGLEHYSYLIEWAGRRLYFVGDTESADALAAQKDLDVAFVTPWLYRTAVREGRTIDARRIVIYHHQSGENPPPCDRCVVPAQNARITFADRAA